MAPVPFVLFCCVFSSGDLRVVAVWPGFCLCLSGFALNCRTKVFHIVCFSFTRFSHCWNRASEQNRPQYRKKKHCRRGWRFCAARAKTFARKNAGPHGLDEIHSPWVASMPKTLRVVAVAVFCLFSFFVCFHDMPQL